MTSHLCVSALGLINVISFTALFLLWPP